jgi:uncharacterized protein
MERRDGQILFSPSDLNGFLACEHLTALSLSGTPRPAGSDPQVELVRRKGEEHEAAYLAKLRAEGKDVREIELDGDWAAAAAATEQAMRDGVAVVYQGVFVDGTWRGVADFLLRVEEPSSLGSWSYEALDTKLARHAKPAYILQLCFYDEQVSRVQGRPPARIHVLLGSGGQESFRADEFGAYYRRVRSRLEAFAADPPPTEPWPVAHCGVCDFKPLCDARWDEVDHLSRVAGMRRTQIEKLLASGVATLAALGRAGTEPPDGIAPETYEKLREQAELQLGARETGTDAYRVLRHEPGVGLALLPEPDEGDLFFDFEGNPFWDPDGGLEYLWGILDADRTFTPLHAHDHASEREALERFVDLVHARLAEHPCLHVYHYAQYEVAALKRLVARYGTREDELDDLLRRDVFVDLFAVVRNGIRTSRPGYGLKELERFLPFERLAEIRDGGSSIVAFEAWMLNGDQALLDEIDAYNREDCIATLLLRDWLLEVRAEAVAAYGAIPPLVPDEPKAAPEHRLARSALQERLVAVGEEVAAHLLDYHAREAKPVWWAFFDRLERTVEELVEDPESVGGLVQVGEPEWVTKRSRAFEFTFPAQELKLRVGQEVRDPATGKSAGELLLLDRDGRRLRLRRGPSLDAVRLPQALIPGGPFRTPDQEEALARFGRSLLAGGGRYPALESILRREPFPHPVQTGDLDEMKALVRSLDGRHLVIQGPPGSGKTWTSGRLIADLIEAGFTVGVASTSHKAIHNLLDCVEEAAVEAGLPFEGLKKASGGNPESTYESANIVSVWDSEACAGVDVTGGTAWHYARECHDGTLDYLFVDEAGQVSLADALAMGTAARNVVLVGDPQQLAQVIQGTHPGGTEASVLTWLLDGAETIPPDRGLFLERTFRLHPDICRFVSEEFYEGRLAPDPVTATRGTPLGTGLRFVPVEHEGCRQESEEEVSEVAAIVGRLLEAGIAAGEVMVVSPYNMQVSALAEVLPAGVRVGTVDKFQGQEADVVVYSMASSSGEDVPRGLEFLLSRNRLNVAVSRARCLAYLVASPRLLEVSCRTIAQMRLANALCRFVELVALGNGA